MAGPLRELAKVVREIEDGIFDPDATRSGQLIGPGPVQPAQQAPSSSSSSGSSVTSSDPEPVLSEAEAPPGLFEQDRFVKNASSGRIHVQRSDGALVCARAMPVRFSILESLPAGARFCAGCF